MSDKSSRPAALLDALAAVYASIFSPDPIQYRAERGLLDQHEEMGIMIQQVVGTRVGRYFFPAFSGVGFSNNEFRWSPRIKREDGLLRLVPGLGTRAVDCMADDYPILIAPGQPNLRVNVTPEETLRYAPKKIDVIDLEENAFRTMELSALLADVGPEYPAIANLISIFEDNRMRAPNVFNLDFGGDHVVFTFEGLVTRTPFLNQMRSLFALLRNTMRTPVDIEFACDGNSFYLLQCRPQSYSLESVPAPIPRDIPESQIIFSANRYVSNGKTADIDLIIHFDGTPAIKHGLELWLEGWSLALAEMNYLRTGRRRRTLLDIRFVTQQDIVRQPGFAAKIGAVTDPARCLTLGRN